MNGEFIHRPVLLEECLEGLNIHPDGIYVDGTLGRGGHSVEIAKRLNEKGRLICIDRDKVAIEEAARKLAPWKERVLFLHGDFREIDSMFDAAGISEVDGMLFDLGVSSPQLDDPSRGFSYQYDAPLDMRMNQDDVMTAHTIVNRWPKSEIQRILSQYGEERYAAAIASAICRAREREELRTTAQLVSVIRSAMPAAALREKQHPAKRSFQGLRIAVNDELGAIATMLTKAISRLRPAGRIAVISFHSLEDRIVKSAFRQWAQGCTCPPEFPVCVCGKRPEMKIITKKPILPTEEELRENPRSRSAKLRVAEKIAY